MRSAILHGAAALATFALVLTSVPDVGAATVLTTALVVPFNNQTPIRRITNIDKTPITVTVQFINASTGTPIPSTSNGCPVPPATLAPGTACAWRSWRPTAKLTVW